MSAAANLLPVDDSVTPRRPFSSVFFSILLAVTGCVFAYLFWRTVLAGTPSELRTSKHLIPQDPKVGKHGVQHPHQFARKVFSLRELGVYEAEFVPGKPELNLRHTPTAADAPITFWSGIVRAPFSEVRLVGSKDPSFVLLEHGEPTAAVSGLYPLRDMVIEPNRPSWPCDQDGKETDPQDSVGRSGTMPSIDDYIVAGAMVAEALTRGQPPARTESIQIDSVIEVVFVHVTTPPDSQGGYGAELINNLFIAGRMLRPDQISIEVGTVADPYRDYELMLSVNDGPAYVPTYTPVFGDPTPAVSPPGLCCAGRQATYLLISTPEDSKHFNLHVRYSQNEPHSNVQAWCFISSDFGGQAAIPVGYKAYVMWDTPLLMESIRANSQPAHQVKWNRIGGLPADLASKFVGLPEVEGLQDGFMVEASSTCESAAVYYVPQF